MVETQPHALTANSEYAGHVGCFILNWPRCTINHDQPPIDRYMSLSEAERARVDAEQAACSAAYLARLSPEVQRIVLNAEDHAT